MDDEKRAPPNSIAHITGQLRYGEVSHPEIALPRSEHHEAHQRREMALETTGSELY